MFKVSKSIALVILAALASESAQAVAINSSSDVAINSSDPVTAKDLPANIWMLMGNSKGYGGEKKCGGMCDEN